MINQNNSPFLSTILKIIPRKIKIEVVKEFKVIIPIDILLINIYKNKYHT